MVKRKAIVWMEGSVEWVKISGYDYTEIKNGLLFFIIYMKDEEDCEYEQDIATFKNWLWWKEVTDEK